MTSLIFLFAIPLTQASPTLTMDEAVDIALKEAFAVRQSEILERRSQDLVDLAKVGAGLNVNVQGTYSRLEQRDVKTSAFGGGFGPQKDSASLTLNVSQYVDISGAIRRAVNQARLNKTASVLATEAAKNSIKALVRVQYLSVLQAQEAVVIQEDEVKAAKERLSKAEARFRADAVPRFDVLRLETDLRRAEQNLVVARQNALLAKQELNNTLGRAIDTPFELAPIEGAAPKVADSSTLSQLALKTRPDLKASETSLKGLGEALAREKLGLSPSLVVSATHTETLTQLSSGGAKGQTVGAVVITMPVYDSDLTRTRVRSAKKDVESASIQLEQNRLAVALEVQASLTRLTAAQEAYEVALKTEQLAKEALRLAQLRYDENVGILVDVIDAQAQYTAARSSLASARYATLAAYAGLQQAVGADDFRNPEPKESKS